jgi:hypothetical protein
MSGARAFHRTADEEAAPAAWSKAASEKVLPAGNLTVQS